MSARSCCQTCGTSKGVLIESRSGVDGNRADTWLCIKCARRLGEAEAEERLPLTTGCGGDSYATLAVVLWGLGAAAVAASAAITVGLLAWVARALQ